MTPELVLLWLRHFERTIHETISPGKMNFHYFKKYPKTFRNLVFLSGTFYASFFRYVTTGGVKLHTSTDSPVSWRACITDPESFMTVSNKLIFVLFLFSRVRCSIADEHLKKVRSARRTRGKGARNLPRRSLVINIQSVAREWERVRSACAIFEVLL